MSSSRDALRAAIEAHQARFAEVVPRAEEPYEVRYQLGPNGFPLGHAIVTGEDGQPRLEPYEMSTSVAWFERRCAELGVDLDSDDEDEPDPELEDLDAELDIDIDIDVDPEDLQ